MEHLVKLLVQLIVVFFDLELGKEISFKTRKEVLHLANNVQAIKSNFDARNEIALTIKKYENEIFSNSLITYICMLNLNKHIRKFEPAATLNKIPEIQKLNILLENKDFNEDYKSLMSLRELIGDVKKAEKENIQLITDGNSHMKYIIDNDNFLWLIRENETKERILSSVKCISMDNGLLVGLDIYGKFWKFCGTECKKEYVPELRKYTFDRMYDMPNNEYLLITTQEVKLRVNLHAFQAVHIESFEIPISKLVGVAFNDTDTFFMGDMGEVYNKHRVHIKSNILSIHVGRTAIIFIDVFGKVFKRSLDTLRYYEIPIPERIKDVAFTKSGPVFLSYDGNVYFEIDKYIKPMMVEKDIEEIHEIFEGVLLINKEETRLINNQSKFEIEKYRMHFKDIDLLS